MTVDKVENATSSNSAVHYRLTIRIWPDDLRGSGAVLNIYRTILKAINGIAMYAEGDDR